MATKCQINHVTLVVDNLDAARAFYEREFGFAPIPAFNLDFPAQFYRINDTQQLHITEWSNDRPSFRGHLCLQVEDFNALFWRMRELGVIDAAPWGRVRRLPDGAMQMFIRDPANNLIEISCRPDVQIDASIFADEFAEAGTSVYVSQREDSRGLRGEAATLYHSGDQS